MIELFIFLFVLQGDNPSEWLQSCDTDFANYVQEISETNPDVYFCNVVRDLRLTESDVDKLGKELNWFNYTMQSSKEFVDNWDFYQDYAINDTLLIYPSIGTRDILPPAMKVQISFNYQDGDTISSFDESFKILPEFNPPICQDDSEIFKCNEKPLYGLDCPITHKFSQETQNCEIWWDSAYVVTLLLALFASIGMITTIIIIKHKKKSV